MGDVYIEGEEEADIELAPVQLLDEEQEKLLREYLRVEVDEATSERADKVEKWSKWRRQREARPEKSSKNSPWPNSSNVSVPLAAINTNAASAKLEGTFDRRKPFFRASTENRKDTTSIEQAEAITDVFEFLVESPLHLNLRTKNHSILYEAASLGGQPVKVPWETDIWKYGSDEIMEGQEVERVRHDGPAIIQIPREDFLCRAFVDDIQRAPWIRHRVFLHWHEIQQRAAQGVYDETVLEDIKNAYIVSPTDDSKEENYERRGTSPLETKSWEIGEYHVFWDVYGTGVPIDIVVTIEEETGIFMRQQVNRLGIRPFEMIAFDPVFGSLDGIGVGHKCEHMQDEVDAMHNMRIDTAHIAGIRMFAVRRNCGIKPNEKLRPGKLLFVDNPKEDIVPLQSGEVYGSSLQAEMVAKQYSERATNMGDYQTGFEDSSIGTRATFGGTMFLAQQGGKMFEPTVRSMEDSFSRIGMYVLFQIVANRERFEKDLARFDDKTQMRFREVLAMDMKDIPSRFVFTIETTEVDKTEEARRQEILSLAQLYSMYGEKLIQLSVMAQNPQMPELAKKTAMKLFTGASRLAEMILEHFDVEDTQNYVPDYRKIEQMEVAMQMMQRMEMMRNVGPNGGGNGPPGGIPGERLLAPPAQNPNFPPGAAQ